MNKASLFFLVFLAIMSCQPDDVKNTYTISGKIGYPLSGDFVVANFSVALLSNDQLIATADGGTFSFENLEEGRSYTVVPQPRIDDGKNGLSTLDQVQLDHYINGELTLTEFQKIAADVNKDFEIDAEDLNRITTCIVENNNCPTWRFASADYNGAGTGYIDRYTISKIISNHEVIFVPVKLGDVNGTIQPH